MHSYYINNIKIDNRKEDSYCLAFNLEKGERLMKRKEHQSKENKGRRIILDVCALKSQEAMQIIEEAEKVIVLIGTITELDKHKDIGGEEGKNIRYIARKIREDTKSKKYVCIAKYNKYKYNDDNIIDYCIWHEGTIILTCDNLLCAKAKAHGITYIFPKVEEKPHNIKSSTINDYSWCNVKGVTYKNEKLTILSQTLSDPGFKILIIRNGQLTTINVNHNLILKIGDIIIRIRENCKDVKLLTYEIKQIAHSNYAEYIGDTVLKYPISDSIKKLNLPTEVKKEICLLVNDEAYEEETKQEAIYLLDGKIYERQPNYKTYIAIERNGSLVKEQNYTQGDLIYYIKVNKRRKSLTMNLYKVSKVIYMYNLQKVDGCSIESINEIYQLNCSEELKDKIRDFYVRNIKY